MLDLHQNLEKVRDGVFEALRIINLDDARFLTEAKYGWSKTL